MDPHNSSPEIPHLHSCFLHNVIYDHDVRMTPLPQSTAPPLNHGKQPIYHETSQIMVAPNACVFNALAQTPLSYGMSAPWSMPNIDFNGEKEVQTPMPFTASSPSVSQNRSTQVLQSPIQFNPLWSRQWMPSPQPQQLSKRHDPAITTPPAPSYGNSRSFTITETGSPLADSSSNQYPSLNFPFSPQPTPQFNPRDQCNNLAGLTWQRDTPRPNTLIADDPFMSDAILEIRLNQSPIADTVPSSSNPAHQLHSKPACLKFGNLTLSGTLIRITNNEWVMYFLIRFLGINSSAPGFRDALEPFILINTRQGRTWLDPYDESSLPEKYRYALTRIGINGDDTGK